MSLKLQQLRHLLALDEHGSFVQAAASLHISQPALSRSIQGLEAQVGAPLFLRDGHGVVPTDLGRVLMNRARQITRLTDALQDEMVGRQALMAQEFVVGAGPFPAATVVSLALARMVAMQPDFRLRVEVRNWDDLLVRLKSHELHLFVAESSTLEHAPDLHVEPLSKRPLYFFARRGHPLSGRPVDDIGAVFQYPTASLARIPPRMLDPILSALRRPSAADVDPRTLPTLLCTDMGVVKAVVANSDAVMVASLACVADELEREELVVVGTEPWMRQEYSLVMLRSKQAAGVAAAMFREQLLAAQSAIDEREENLAARLALTP